MIVTGAGFGYSVKSLPVDCAADWSTIALFAERVAISAAWAATCHVTLATGSSPGTAA